MRPGILHGCAIVFIAGKGLLASGQCCSGGSGSPVAGGTSQGVLMDKQIELNTNYQFVQTDAFFKGDKAAPKFFKYYKSQYLYSRVAMGLTPKFTLSLEMGYWINRYQKELYNDEHYETKGVSDLIIFPRYNILDKKLKNGNVEVTVGTGFKIPLGKYNASVKRIEPFSGSSYYLVKPISVQQSSGSQDLLLYGFGLRNFSKQKIKVFMNAIHILKGWNPIGEKQGDFTSAAIFLSKTLNLRFTGLLQLRGEFTAPMKINETMLNFAYPNYDPKATGYRKLFISPQITFVNRKKVMVYALADIPVYQYLFETQAGSQYQLMAGISYRFQLKDKSTLSND